MAASPADLLTRRVGPTTVVTLSQITWPARASAATRRRLGRRGRVELFFAFDDAASAVAVIDLAERVAGRDVALLLKPVVHRGIPDDPAAGRKRRYAITDARRLGRRRLGLELSREAPLAAGDTAFLAAWAASIPPGGAQTGFCRAALRRLWFETDEPLDRDAYAGLWRAHTGTEPPPGGEDAVRAAETLMARRGPYDTPAAWIHGRWYFAQDRGEQIGEWLDELGWAARP